MGWHKFTKKLTHRLADISTGGLSYAERKQREAQEEAANAAAEEQRRANAEIERLQMIQAGATPTETVAGTNLALEDASKKSALRRSILSRSQNASNKLGA